MGSETYGEKEKNAEGVEKKNLRKGRKKMRCRKRRQEEKGRERKNERQRKRGRKVMDREADGGVRIGIGIVGGERGQGKRGTRGEGRL